MRVVLTSARSMPTKISRACRQHNRETSNCEITRFGLNNIADLSAESFMWWPERFEILKFLLRLGAFCFVFKS